MIPPDNFGKLLIFLGAILLIVGAVIVLVGKIPWLGRLPGDIVIERRHVTFYFPLATSILISIIVSLVLYLIARR